MSKFLGLTVQLIQQPCSLFEYQKGQEFVELRTDLCIYLDGTDDEYHDITLSFSVLWPMKHLDEAFLNRIIHQYPKDFAKACNRCCLYGAAEEIGSFLTPDKLEEIVCTLQQNDEWRYAV